MLIFNAGSGLIRVEGCVDLDGTLVVDFALTKKIQGATEIENETSTIVESIGDEPCIRGNFDDIVFDDTCVSGEEEGDASLTGRNVQY